MIKNKEISELTLSELYQEKKKRKGVISVLVTAMIILCGVLIFGAIKSKNYALIAVACGSFVTLFPSINYLGQIEKEIKNREKK